MKTCFFATLYKKSPVYLYNTCFHDLFDDNFISIIIIDSSTVKRNNNFTWKKVVLLENQEKSRILHPEALMVVVIRVP